MAELKRVWRYRPKTKSSTVAIAYWNGKYALARDCMEIVEGGELKARICGDNESSDVSVYKGTFLFGNYDGNVYMVSEEGKLLQKFHVGLPKSIAVTMLADGFVTCGEECALYDVNGNRIWNIKVGYVANGPAYWQGYLFVPDHGKKVSILLKDTGMLMMDLPVGSPVYDVATCDKMLAIAARGKVALLDISDMGRIKDIWIKSGIEKPWNVAFSPDCNYVAFSDAKRGKLRVYSRRGNLIAKESFRSPPWGVGWGEELVVGLEDGTVEAYELKAS
ncbi:hypothetical protein IPA_08295 [Ignicoccus pacificus DSM 13166]|uniref:Uncharacterized protein n=1 Tax=Ignicoccus pacificus DSM 13166 TaxID=940294 RepID=A0A977KBS9_9CREN|nr:hypothetical protein IPA_08295 [Ignicoccus pacificus DSM 13166]